MKGVAVFILLVCTTIGEAASLDSKEAARKLTDQVMAKVASGDLDGGLLLLKPYLIIPDSEFKVMLEQTKLQLPAIQGRFGKIIGSEFINEKMIGKSLLQIIQLQKFQKHAMRWRFIFYSPDGKWVLNTFNFDDKIQLLFGE
ncbi:MAG: hypothetical protein Q7N50_05890 [Armatimonadota bacterium]|nr:hypothetical protein [Armatimonadota bacterium]